MDSSKHHANKKRPRSASNEYGENSKKTHKLSGWFVGCCTQRKHHIRSSKNESIEKVSLVNENKNLQLKCNISQQSTRIEEISNVHIVHLKQSPLYRESRFCQTPFESYEDSCINCTVQYGPNLSEDIHEYYHQLNQQLNNDNNKSMPIEEVEVSASNSLQQEKSIDQAVNSFINNIIGDGIDRLFNIITMASTYRSKQNDFRIDNKTKESLDIIEQNQYSELVFEKQNLKIAPTMNHQSSAELSLDDFSPNLNPDVYPWNITVSETHRNQQKELDKKSSLENQEPYNWDDQKYSCSSAFDLYEKDHLVDKSVHDPSKHMLDNAQDKSISDEDDDTNLSYSVASVLPSHKTMKPQSHTNHLQNSSLNIINSKKFFSTSDQENEDQHITSYNNLLLKKNSNDLSELVLNKIQKINSSNLTKTHNNIEMSSFHKDLQIPNLSEQESSPKIYQSHRLMQQSYDQSSTTSANDLFNQISYAKKQNSIDSDSINTGYSIPVSLHTSALSETAADRNDQHEKQRQHVEIKNNVNHTFRFTYDDIMNTWRRLFERLLGSVLSPSINNTGNKKSSSSSSTSSDSYSWSTPIPTEGLNITESNHMSPWWERRDVYSRTLATFRFANERLSTSYPIEKNASNKQMCISIENRPCCSKYDSYQNIYHCCCRSSITINNCSSSF
ncbi:unnamed protein product [Rotaria socialis]